MKIEIGDPIIMAVRTLQAHGTRNAIVRTDSAEMTFNLPTTVPLSAGLDATAQDFLQRARTYLRYAAVCAAAAEYERAGAITK